jgi:GT2 family glycosyltransferase
MLSVSIMITTHNRSNELLRTARVLKKLSPAPLEIMITVDGCTDDTLEVAKNELPGARLIVNQPGLGSVASRDRMMREAKGDLVLALDDDSYPEQMDCLQQVAPLFEKQPKLAIVHFPQRTDEYPETLHCKDFGPAKLTRTFANSGAMLRRSIYLQLPGFEPRFFHMYEEPDFALQCVTAAYDVLFTPVVSIRHHFSPLKRNESRNHRRHCRNELWSAVMRCPFPQLLPLIGYRALAQWRYACKRGASWVIQEPIWWWQALAGVPYCLKKRNPIPWSQYKTWLWFQK